MTATAYPLQWPPGWPRTSDSHKVGSLFKADYGKACRKLNAELRMLRASNVVISSEVPIAKQTGMPFADWARRRLSDTGVAVYFTWKNRERVMARDAHWTVHENIMSIAHAIEHMRGLSRHGGDHMMTQAFEGFTALPAPENMKPKRPWWEVFGLPADCDDREMIEAVFRHKIKKAHPDNGGSDDAMKELNEARREALS